MTPLKYNTQLHSQLIQLLEAEGLQQINNELTMQGYLVYIVYCYVVYKLEWCELPCRSCYVHESNSTVSGREVGGQVRW